MTLTIMTYGGVILIGAGDSVSMITITSTINPFSKERNLA
jgi:hypothetical protein